MRVFIEAQTLCYADTDPQATRLPFKSITREYPSFEIPEAEITLLQGDLRQPLAATYQPSLGYQVKPLYELNLTGVGVGAVDQHGRLVAVRQIKNLDQQY